VRFAAAVWLFGALGALGVGVLLVLGAYFRQKAVRRFGDEALVLGLSTAKAGGRRAFKGVVLVLSLSLAFVSLAQPQYGRGTRLIPATDLDVILVMDYSKSMYARDISPSRIERAKAEVGRLIADLPGARFGAVAFAGDAMAFPLTSDGSAIAQFLRQLSPNDMPVGGTAIARALEAGRELLARDPLSKDHRRVIVLVTDGEDLEGDPVAVSKAAGQDGVTVFVVQVGGRTPEPIPEVNEAGQVTGFRTDSNGNPLTTELSAAGEEQLTKVAEASGGEIARSQKGSTGIDLIAARLRQMMSEELSEKVETVYADVYAYPLALALLLLVLETLISEAPRRDRAATPPRPPKRSKRRKRAARPAAAGLVAAMLLGLLSSSCERANDLFMRDSPAVNQSIEALDAGDAGAAVSLLEEYLSTGKCENGNIGTPDSVRERPNAAFDLGLGLFQIAEKYGKRFGDELETQSDAGLDPNEEADLAKRSAEVDCALRIVRMIAGDASVPGDLRARAYYLAGNLEFLRREYSAAVTAYDSALKLVPGVPGDAGDGLGRDAAYNRAIALRRAEEQQQDASPPDAGQDGGEPPEAGPDAEPEQDAGQDSGGGDDDQPDAGNDAGNQDQPDAGGEDGGGANEPPEQQQQQQQQEPQAQDQNRDERLLDMLEQAPTLEQERAKARARTRVTGGMEDK
jgi:Ca-activated chloride channel family protein